MITTIVLLFICILYAALEGEREAWYYHLKVRCNQFATKDIPNEHSTFTLQRLMFWIFASYLAHYLMNSPLIGAVSLIFVFSSFPFFHDGTYYLERNRLDPNEYKKGWFDNSKTSTAKLNINLIWRIVLLFIGILLEILAFVINHYYNV